MLKLADKSAAVESTAVARLNSLKLKSDSYVKVLDVARLRPYAYAKDNCS